MDELKVGIAYPDGPDSDIVAFATTAEELGFSSIWVGEHIANWRPLMTVMPALGAMAACTKKVTIGSAILLLPLRHPTLTAKELCVLDRISNGRLAVGVGSGGENPAEFAACGVPVEQRFGRTNEALQIMRRLWREQSVSFNGKYFNLDSVTIQPGVVQEGGPPLYVSGRRIGAMRRAVRYADGFMPYLYTPEQYAKGVAQMRAFADEGQRDLAGFEHLLYQFIVIADNRAEARRVAEGHAQHYGPDAGTVVDRFFVAGTPDDCIARLREYVDAGARHIIFAFAATTKDTRDQIRVIAREITPKLLAAQ